MKKLSWWFRPHGLIYGNFRSQDLKDTTCPSVQFWRVFREMLRTMWSAGEERCFTGCMVEFQEERWCLSLSIGPQPSIDMQPVPNEQVFDKLKELVRKRIRPYFIEIYEPWARVLFCIGPETERKTKYVVTIHRVRK